MLQTAPGQPLSKLLKTETSADHEALDRLITSKAPFASLDAYRRFLEVQANFHRRIAGLYDDARWTAIIPDLGARRRAGAVEQDLRDLEAVPLEGSTVEIGDDGLGWLYVAEGSTLGAAFLLREVKTLGLDETFGARHLGGAPDGRRLNWRQFTEAIDRAELSEAERSHAVRGAKRAFASVRADVEKAFA